MMRRLGSNARYNIDVPVIHRNSSKTCPSLLAGRNPTETATNNNNTNTATDCTPSLSSFTNNRTNSFEELPMDCLYYPKTNSIDDEKQSTLNGFSQWNMNNNNNNRSDSGFEECAPQQLQVLNDKIDLNSETERICGQLTTIVHLMADFLRDVQENSEQARELLDELQNKMHPFLVMLDEEMSSVEGQLRRNLDRSRISDARVDWLLQYNRYVIEFRRILQQLTGPVYGNRS